jgi:hypothetical protein
MEMKIIKVLVDRLPKSCEDCSIIQWDRYMLNCWCGVNKYEDVEKYCRKNTRPEWCPLVTGDKLLFEHSVMKRWLEKESEE